MVAITADKVVVELEAKFGQYDARVNGARQNFTRSMAAISRSGRSAELATGRSMRGLGSAIAVLDGPLGGVASRFRALGTVVQNNGAALGAFAIAVGGLTLATRSWLQNTVRQEAAETSLQNAIRATGRETELSLPALTAYASALQGITTFGDEAIIETQALLTTFTNIGGDVLPRTTRAVLDFAQATGRDLRAAAQIAGVALQDPAEAFTRLQREGIRFSNAQKRTLQEFVRVGDAAKAQDLILKELEKRYKGAAEAARNTFGGALKALGNTIGDQTEVTGGSLASMTDAVNYLNDNLGNIVDTIKIIAAVGGPVLIGRFLGPATAATIRAATAHVEYAAALARGDAVAVGGMRAAEMRAAATLGAAQADEKAALAALNKARSVQAAAVVSATDTNAQFARAAATKQLAILEAQATAATRTRVAAETAHAAALARTTIAARAAAVAVRSYALLSGLLGGPLGIALTALAGTYLLVSRRSAAAADRTERLSERMRELGIVSEDAADGMDKASQSLDKLADDQRRTLLAEIADELDRIRGGGILSIFRSVDSSGIRDVVKDLEMLGATAGRIDRPFMQTARAVAELGAELESGSISQEEFNRRLAELSTQPSNRQVDSYIGRLRDLGAELFNIIELQRRAGETFAASAGDKLASSLLRAVQGFEDVRGFLDERTRSASLDDQARAIERRADAIQKEAEKLDIVISKEAALRQARREIGLETGRSEAERLAKLAEQDAGLIEDMQRAVEIFGDERQQAIDRAVRSLSERATAAEIEQVKDLAGAVYDLAEQRRRDAVINNDAKAEAIQAIRDEAAQLGVVGGALVELQFIQERYNELRAANIPITQEIIRQIEAEGAALRGVYEEVEAGSLTLRNNIQITDAVRQGFIDIGKAGVRGFDDLGDAALRALENISAMILELYVLKPLVESILGPSGAAAGGSIGSLLGFATGTANTGGRRGEPRGIVHGQEAVIPLPAGGKVPVEIKMPAALKAGGAGGGAIHVQTTVNVTEGSSETQTRGTTDRTGRELAGMIEGAVRNVMQREKRQGGLLWNPGAR
jgi:hypothetical protein